MKAKYIGYPDEQADESPRYVTHLGVTFRRDRWATLPGTVTDAQLTKLKAHPHFEVAEGEGEPDEAEPEAVAGAGAAGSGSGGKTPAIGKEAIVERLQAIANKHPEFEFNAKLGAPKLAAILEQAEFEYGED